MMMKLEQLPVLSEHCNYSILMSRLTISTTLIMQELCIVHYEHNATV